MKLDITEKEAEKIADKCISHIRKSCEGNERLLSFIDKHEKEWWESEKKSAYYDKPLEKISAILYK